MKKPLKYAAALLSGTAYGLLIIVLSRCLIRNLGALVSGIGSAAGLDYEIIAQLAMALDQLADAQLGSPWFPFPAVATATVIFTLCPLRSAKKRTVLLIVLGILLLVPFTLTAVWFTEVNDIRMGALLHNLLSLLPGLL